jgi:hypothetical protein
LFVPSRFLPFFFFLSPFTNPQQSRETGGNFETIQRSGTCYYRCVLSALRYMLKVEKISSHQQKQFFFVVRRAFLEQAEADLVTFQEKKKTLTLARLGSWNFNDSDAKMVEIACQQVGLLLLLFVVVRFSLFSSFFVFFSFAYFLFFFFFCTQTGYAGVKEKKRSSLTDKQLVALHEMTRALTKKALDSIIPADSSLPTLKMGSSAPLVPFSLEHVDFPDVEKLAGQPTEAAVEM